MAPFTFLSNAAWLGIAAIGLVALVLLAVLRLTRRGVRSLISRAHPTPGKCRRRDCHCQNPAEARFCKRCGKALNEHSTDGRAASSW